MHTTERHRNKRPFQPSITNYFARDTDDYDSENDDDLRGLSPNTRPRTQTQHHHKATLAPQVPGHVQSDLMQVGMRVRKSVPEGYKTHSNKMSCLPSIQTTMSKPSSTTTTTITLESRAPAPDDFVHQRELLPFCGLHKIGGYADQPTTNIHLYAGVDSTTGHRPANMFPLPAEAFSQPFVSSHDFEYVPSNPSKRSWHDEEDLSRSTFLFGTKGPVVEIDEVPVSPLSEIPAERLPKVRMVKMPKSRRRMGDGSVDIDMEEVQVGGRLVVGIGSDFEEADFLNGGEVVMGGV